MTTSLDMHVQRSVRILLPIFLSSSDLTEESNSTTKRQHGFFYWEENLGWSHAFSYTWSLRISQVRLWNLSLLSVSVCKWGDQTTMWQKDRWVVFQAQTGHLNGRQLHWFPCTFPSACSALLGQALLHHTSSSEASHIPEQLLLLPNSHQILASSFVQC